MIVIKGEIESLHALRKARRAISSNPRAIFSDAQTSPLQVPEYQKREEKFNHSRAREKFSESRDNARKGGKRACTGPVKRARKIYALFPVPRPVSPFYSRRETKGRDAREIKKRRSARRRRSRKGGGARADRKIREGSESGGVTRSRGKGSGWYISIREVISFYSLFRVCAAERVRDAIARSRPWATFKGAMDFDAPPTSNEGGTERWLHVMARERGRRIPCFSARGGSAPLPTDALI